MNVPNTNSRIYTIGVRHMERDNPDLPRSLAELTSMMDTHAQLIIGLANLISHTIRTRLAASDLSLLKVGSRYNAGDRAKYDLLASMISWYRNTIRNLRISHIL